MIRVFLMKPWEYKRQNEKKPAKNVLQNSSAPDALYPGPTKSICPPKLKTVSFYLKSNIKKHQLKKEIPKLSSSPEFLSLYLYIAIYHHSFYSLYFDYHSPFIAKG